MNVKIKILKQICDFIFVQAYRTGIKEINISGIDRWSVPENLWHGTSFTTKDAVITSVSGDYQYIKDVIDKKKQFSTSAIVKLGFVFIDVGNQLDDDKDLSFQFVTGFTGKNDWHNVSVDRLLLNKTNQSPAVTVNLKVLKKACDMLFTYFDIMKIEEIEIDRIFYWTLISEEWIDLSQKPSQQPLGSLEDDYEYIEIVLDDEYSLTNMIFNKVGAIFMAIGYQLEREYETKQNKE